MSTNATHRCALVQQSSTAACQRGVSFGCDDDAPSMCAVRGSIRRCVLPTDNSFVLWQVGPSGLPRHVPVPLDGALVPRVLRPPLTRR
eukprot:214128-Prymnesium_polylepis.1